jgi:hypothetical protein
MKKPCIILRSRRGIDDVFAAFNEDGRRVHRSSLYVALVAECHLQDYEVAPLNSRIGRTICDKLEQKGVI